MLSWAYGQLPSLSAPHVKLEKEPVHEFETKPEKRARTMKHLLHRNHTNHAVIYHELRFHNHTPHILGSAYILGAPSGHLDEIYEVESHTLEPWRDSPGEITEANWRQFLGNRLYQRAYMDFFEDQIPACGNDWKAVVEKILFSGKEPLINNIISGLGHTFIHMGYAYELNSRTIASEALVLSACFYNDMHKYLDDPKYTKPSPNPSKDPLELLHRIRSDKRFDDAPLIAAYPGDDDSGEPALFALLDSKEDATLEYWNALEIPSRDPTSVFAACQKLAVSLLVGTHREDNKYDFFLVHLLTSSHAMRHLLPLLPARVHLSVVRQWWLFVVTVYISQARPGIQIDRIEKYDPQGKDWAFVVKTAVEGEYRNDAHHVKALRAMKNAAETWGDPENFFLKAAVKFGTEFSGWGF